MRIRVRCPRCWQTAEITEDQLGKSGVCNRCGSPVKIPARLNRVCFVCGTDIAKGRHYKDDYNNYLCGPCFSERKVTERSAFSLLTLECSKCHARFDEGEGFEVNGKPVCADCHSHAESDPAPGTLSSVAEPIAVALGLETASRNRPSADDSGADMPSIIDDEPLPRRKGALPPQPSIPVPAEPQLTHTHDHDDHTVVPVQTSTSRTIVRSSSWPAVVGVICLLCMGVLALTLLSRNSDLSQRLATTETALADLRKTLDATHDAIAKRHQDTSDQFDQQRRQMDKFRGDVQSAMASFQQSLASLQAAPRQPVAVNPPPGTQPALAVNNGGSRVPVEPQPTTKPVSIFDDGPAKTPATAPVQPPRTNIFDDPPSRTPATNPRPNIFDDTANLRKPTPTPPIAPKPAPLPGSRPSKSIFDD